MWDDTSLGEWDTLICRVPVSARPILTTSFAAKLRRGSIRTCSAACFRRAHARCVCVPSPSTGSGHRKCGNATGRGRRCTGATRGFSGRLWDWAFSKSCKKNRNYHSDRADYDSGDRASAAACHGFREVAKKRRPARSGATEVGTTPLRGASIRITAAGAATAAIMHHAGDPLRGPVSEYRNDLYNVQPLADHCNFRDGSKQSLKTAVAGGAAAAATATAIPAPSAQAQ